MSDERLLEDIGAESGLLGSIMLEGEANHDRACTWLDSLSESLFYDKRLLCVYRNLVKLQFGNDPITPLALHESLIALGEDKDAGGFAFYSGLANVGTSQNFSLFRKRVRDMAARRAALADADKARRIALDLTTPFHTGDIIELLDERRFDHRRIVEDPEPIFTLAGVGISTTGNLTTITAHIKTGKTAVVSAMSAAPATDNRDADNFTFTSSNPLQKSVLRFDTEQSTADFYKAMEVSRRRAGVKVLPSWMHGYCLTGLDYKKAWQCVKEGMDRAADLHQGIHSIFLDGIGDFVADVNDTVESNEFVARLHGLAMKFECPIISVLHFNPGSDKSRGHLGSQLERKSETNLTLEKDDQERTEIFSTKNRRASIPKGLGPRFQYSTEAGMHVSIESGRRERDASRAETLRNLAEDVFDGHPSMRYADLQVTVKKRLKCSDRTSERKLSEMVKLAVIEKREVGLYAITSAKGV